MSFQGTYTGDRSEQALQWVEEVTGRDHGPDSFGDSLRDGVALCELAEKLLPGPIRKISHSKMPFPQRENVAAFTDACRAVGVLEFDLFSTADLFEFKNLEQVVTCLFALGKAAYSLPDYGGPCLGPPPKGKGGRARHHTVVHGDTLAGKPGAGASAVPIGGHVDVGMGIQDVKPAAHKIRVTEGRGTAALKQMEAMRRGAATNASMPDSSFRAKMPSRDRLVRHICTGRVLCTNWYCAPRAAARARPTTKPPLRSRIASLEARPPFPTAQVPERQRCMGWLAAASLCMAI